MNRLAQESSPYLLQHAHNPVDWYPWGDEAFAKAKAENKLVLVSIGYSTCHWCHVMERESFEDLETARFMNEHFVNIKVDREERPDVDHIYMEAVQIINRGGGGWPLNCFLLPDARPFYGGTYYPPEPAHGRPSWRQVLQSIMDTYTRQPEVIQEQATKLLGYMHNSEQQFVSSLIPDNTQDDLFNREYIDQMYYRLREGYDRVEGGFGNAPKFPGTMSIRFLFSWYHYTHEQDALDHALFSIDRMIQGGIYDQIGGGFSRYTVDRAWLVPHFEKMLYDNALLIWVMAEAYQITRKEIYATTIRETIVWLNREMKSPEGAYYSALDADSEGVEGKFYVWDKSEIDAVLGPEAALFNAYYGVTEQGNWEHKNILNRHNFIDAFAAEQGLALDECTQRIEAAKQKMLEARALRIRPGLDDKILLDWNALMVSALVKAGLALNDQALLDDAETTMRFLMRAFKDEERTYGLFHSYKAGQAKNPANLNDYAYCIEAMLDVYKVRFDEAWLELAQEYMLHTREQFLDERDGLFFFSPASATDLVMRRKELFDGAMPSSNAIMLHNLARMAVINGNRFKERELAQVMLYRVHETMLKYPGSFSHWAYTVLGFHFGQYEIAITGAESFKLAKELMLYYQPCHCVMASKSSSKYPIFTDRFSASGETRIFVCQNFSCQLPVSQVSDALRLMGVKEVW
jgi:uncharacterized protein YyaL (SSP411 family)